MPPPIWPMPGCRWAIPVWTGGESRVAATLRASMPRIAARPSGYAMSGDSPAAMLRHSASMRSTSSGSRPTDGDRERRGRDGQRAEPVRLDDRGVAEVGVHVGGRVAVEQLRRVGQRGGPDEPAVAEPGHADADLDAVPRDRGEHRGTRHVRGAVQRELGEDHRQVQEELAVAGDEGAHLGMLDAERLEGQRGALLGAVVGLVAERERAHVQVVEVERSARGQRRLELRREHVAHPLQALEHLRAVGAVAQDRARALVQRGPRDLPGGLVAGDPDRHARVHDAGHRADAAVVVVGGERDLAVLDELQRLGRRPGDALEPQRGPERGAHRGAHPLRLDRRTGVGHAARRVVGGDLRGGHDVDHQRARSSQPRHRIRFCMQRCVHRWRR